MSVPGVQLVNSGEIVPACRARRNKLKQGKIKRAALPNHPPFFLAFFRVALPVLSRRCLLTERLRKPRKSNRASLKKFYIFKKRTRRFYQNFNI